MRSGAHSRTTPPFLREGLSSFRGSGDRLEADAGRELHLAHVAGGRGVAEAAGIGRRGAVEGAVDGVDVGVVEDVEGLYAKLDSNALGDGKVLLTAVAKETSLGPRGTPGSEFPKVPKPGTAKDEALGGEKLEIPTTPWNELLQCRGSRRAIYRRRRSRSDRARRRGR